jgi:diguanylate cyclase (GGDEF)-like protein/PAS domain S-box-containing protein
MNNNLSILAIEDSSADFRLIERHLRVAGLNAQCTRIETIEELTQAVEAGGWDIILSDYSVPQLNFENDLAFIHQQLPDTPVILVSGSIGEEKAVELLKLGVWDFILKDNLTRLVPSIERCLREVSDRFARKTAEKELSEQQQLLTVVVEGSTDAIFVKDLLGRYLLVNQAASQFVGKPADQIIGHDDGFIFPPSIASEIMAIDKTIMESGNTQTHEETITTIFGEHLIFQVTKGPMLDHNGQVSGLFGISHNITARKKRELALIESETRFSTVFHKNPLAIGISNYASGRFIDVNEAFLQLFCYERNEIIGHTATELNLWVYPEDKARMYTFLSEYGQIQNQELMFRTKTNETGDALLSAELINIGGEQCVLRMLSDITEKNKAQRAINYLAHHDALTGLPNRLLVRDRVEQAIATAKRDKHKVALLFMDLDNFKSINDSLGHASGDSLLEVISHRLRESIRGTDTVSRFGGDEFLVVLSHITGNEAVVSVCTKILEDITKPAKINGHELSTSCSIGVTVYPDDGDDFDALLRKADSAMYYAKDAKGNTYRFFDSKMNEDAIELVGLRNGLRIALERNEFVLHYQPQIDLSSGAVIGAEALIRWQHPELGLLPPGKFITLAEESGLIVPIGEWALREACRQAMAWRKQGLPDLVMAVNLSAIQFRRGNLEETVISALKDSGLDPQFLELELTESILIGDTENVLQTVQRLKTLGIKLSLDDFGTGYSSLSYLKRFAVDKVKIDQSFISDMDKNPSDAAIVRAIIQMSKSLGLRTIAEGIEEEYLVKYLQIYHCDEAQGYYYSRPISSDDFVLWVLASLS